MGGKKEEVMAVMRGKNLSIVGVSETQTLRTDLQLTE